jgi:hypothetical protein
VLLKGMTGEEAKAAILKDRPGLDVVFQDEVRMLLLPLPLVGGARVK